MPTPEELIIRFTLHAPNDKPERYARSRDMAQIRGDALSFSTLIVELTPAGREQALALTNLEQAVMWANAAIARAPEK